MMHKSRTQTEHRARANAMLKSAGAPTISKRASGGKVAGPKTVNVIIKTGNDDAVKKEAMQKGLQLGAQLAGGQKPPMPGPGGPPGMPPGGAPPPMMGGAGAPPMPPHPGAGMMAKGGTVKVRSHVRRKSGGKCE